MSEIEWTITEHPVNYDDAVAVMEETVADIRAGTSPEQIWLLEHPPLYTAGTSARASDLIEAKFPVYETGRGGQYTYHGPGQRVVYVMLDLKKRQQTPDIKQYVCDLEQWIINTLQEFDIKGERREGRVGIWVDSSNGHRLQPSASGHRRADDRSMVEGESRHEPDTPPNGGGVAGHDKKIAAIGVRVRHWVTYHGIAINVNPDLSHFGGIVPCGISDAGVTSFEDLGVNVTMENLDAALQKNCLF
jgi:lipoyl(octanoyl) transferase